MSDILAAQRAMEDLKWLLDRSIRDLETTGRLYESAKGAGNANEAAKAKRAFSNAVLKFEHLAKQCKKLSSKLLDQVLGG